MACWLHSEVWNKLLYYVKQAYQFFFHYIPLPQIVAVALNNSLYAQLDVTIQDEVNLSAK